MPKLVFSEEQLLQICTNLVKHYVAQDLPGRVALLQE